MADIRHLAAAEDGTINGRIDSRIDRRIAHDFDNGFGHTTQIVLVVLVGTATATAIDITHFLVAQQQVKAIVGEVAYKASLDLNRGHAVVDGIVCTIFILLPALTMEIKDS